MRYIIIIALTAIVCMFAYDYFKGIAPGEVVVKQSWLDSLQLVAESTPDTITDIKTVRDTIEIDRWHTHTEIEYIELGKDTIQYIDTLRTPYFDVFLTDKLTGNRIIDRRWRYNVFQKKEIIEHTITQKIPHPYPVQQELPRLYGGINAGSVVSVDINYRINNNFIGVGAGYMGKPYYYIRYQFVVW